MLQLYLAHPFEIRHEVRKMQKEIEKEFNIMLFNPFYDVPQRDDIKKMEKGITVHRTLDDCKKIRQMDLDFVKSMNGVLAFHKKGIYTLGTIKEIFYCYEVCKKPVYLISDDPYFINHLWHRVEIYKVFKSVNEFKKYLEENEYLRK